jgi:hypothetical protein
MPHYTFNVGYFSSARSTKGDFRYKKVSVFAANDAQAEKLAKRKVLGRVVDLLYVGSPTYTGRDFLHTNPRLPVGRFVKADKVRVRGDGRIDIVFQSRGRS